MSFKLQNLLLIIIGSIILLNLAFFNGYPLVYSDSGTYIRSGIMNWIPVDRPIFYGYFINFTSLKSSLWYVVFVQSLILAYLIFKMLQIFFKEKTLQIYYIIAIFILSVFTSASFNVSMLTADIFTAFIYLILTILIFNNDLKKIEIIFLGLLLSLSIITHNSHVLLLIIFLTIGFIILIYSKFILRIKINNKYRYLMVVTFICFSILLLPSLNYLIDGKFRFSDSSHVFLLHKLHDDNILVNYLNEKCQSKNYMLCEYKDSLPWDLIWDSNSPLTKDGNWSKYSEEGNQILFDVLTTFKYLKLFIIKTIHQTFKQFFNFNTGDIPIVDQLLEPPTSAINDHFKMEIREYLSSREFNKRLSFDTINLVQHFTVFISILLLILYLLIHNNKNYVLLCIIYLLFIYLFINAFVCASFSNVLERYQSRIIWLIPLVALIVVQELVKCGLLKINNHLKNISDDR